MVRFVQLDSRSMAARAVGGNLESHEYIGRQGPTPCLLLKCLVQSVVQYLKLITNSIFVKQEKFQAVYYQES